ncbi:8222_t:CDS:1, partial [Scutellospora calospora]
IWAKAERSLISASMRDKRNMNIKEAINDNSLSLKGWPEN